MKQIMGMGKNRTGIGTSPMDAKATIEGAIAGVPDAFVDGAEMAAMRAEYVRDAEPVGTVPPPTTLVGAAKSAGQMITGKHPVVLIDKLAERLAFERTGTRLYEAFLAKVEAAGPLPGMTVEVLRRFHDEERAHLELVKAALEKLGADPTVQTPLADVNGVAAMGLIQVIADPRTSVIQSLHAIHIAELADNDGWEMLIDLASRMGQSDMATAFQQALLEEQQHLAAVRGWMLAGTAAMAGVAS